MHYTPKAFSDYYLSRVEIYINDVLTNKRIVGKRERQAVERYQTYFDKYDFNKDELVKRLKLISLINLPLKGKGINQIILSDWQVFLLMNIYCWYKRGTDVRVIKQVVVSGAGKLGKTTLICLIAITSMVIEDPVNNNFVITSLTTKQSSAILKYCKDIINFSPALNGLFKTLHSNIICKNGAQIMVFTNDSSKLQGTNLKGQISDEIFLVETQDELDVKDIAIEKMSLQKNALQFSIGTVGSTSTNHLVYSDFWIPCINILDGITEADDMFIYIFMVDDEDMKNPEQSSNWIKANPSIPILQTTEELEQKFEKLKAFPLGKRLFFKEKLNRWDTTAAAESFLSDEIVKEMMKNTNEFVQHGSEIIIGLDLATNRDTIDISLLHHDKESKVFTFHNIPIQPNVEKNFVKNDIDLRRWFVKDLQKFKENDYLPDAEHNENGYLIADSKTVMNEDLIFDIIIDLSNKYKIMGIAYDPFSSAQLVSRIEAKKIHCIPISQKLLVQSPVIKYLERQIYQDQVRIVKNALVRWQAKNLVLYQDINGNIKFDKRPTKNGGGSIDCWSAMLTALCLWYEQNQQYVIGKSNA